MLYGLFFVEQKCQWIKSNYLHNIEQFSVFSYAMVYVHILSISTCVFFTCFIVNGCIFMTSTVCFDIDQTQITWQSKNTSYFFLSFLVAACFILCMNKTYKKIKSESNSYTLVIYFILLHISILLSHCFADFILAKTSMSRHGYNIRYNLA